MLDGEIEFEVDGESCPATPGTFAFVPRGAVAHVPGAHRHGPHAGDRVRPARRARRAGCTTSSRPSANPPRHRCCRAPRRPDPAVLTAARRHARHRPARSAAAMRLLLTVAHPDDETFGAARCLAHAAASGVESIVICATRGELGEAADRHRRHTARAGARGRAPGRGHGARGRRSVELLGWSDSGVDGEPAAGSLAAADVSTSPPCSPPVIERAAARHRDHGRGQRRPS